MALLFRTMINSLLLLLIIWHNQLLAEQRGLSGKLLNLFLSFNFSVITNWYLKSDKKFYFRAVEMASLLKILFTNVILPQILITS